MRLSCSATDGASFCLSRCKTYLKVILQPSTENRVDITSHTLLSRQSSHDGDSAPSYLLTIEVNQLCDMTSSVFAILLHSPSISQLVQWEASRKKEREFRKRLREACLVTYEGVFGPTLSVSQHTASAGSISNISQGFPNAFVATSAGGSTGSH